MKKLFVSIIFLAAAVFNQSFAVKPIPSYNVKVNNTANFQEQTSGSQLYTPPTEGKRQMNVETTCSRGVNNGFCSAMIWIYRLDYQKILGPYYVNGGETLTVNIDDNPWGVFVMTNDQLIVSVWIDDGNPNSMNNPSRNRIDTRQIDEDILFQPIKNLMFASAGK